MQIRLTGTPDEIKKALPEFQAASGLVVIDQSHPYPCRGAAALVRVYLEARIVPPLGAVDVNQD